MKQVIMLLCSHTQLLVIRTYSPKHGSVTLASLILPVPALHVHTLGVPPAETLFVGQEAHTPEEG